jgi:hypothetical protein
MKKNDQDGVHWKNSKVTMIEFMSWAKDDKVMKQVIQVKNSLWLSNYHSRA